VVKHKAFGYRWGPDSTPLNLLLFTPHSAHRDYRTGKIATE